MIVPMYVSRCVRMDEDVSCVRQDVLNIECVRMYQDVSGCVRICQDVSGYTKICQDVSGCKYLQYVSGCLMM